MSDRAESSMRFARIGAISAFIAVAAGAFGAHALRARVGADLLSAFETGARYQFFHALALIVLALVRERAPHRVLDIAGWLFVTGTVLFSGSLYALALSGQRMFGIITPLGGLCFLAGWIAMALGCGARAERT